MLDKCGAINAIKNTNLSAPKAIKCCTSSHIFIHKGPLSDMKKWEHANEKKEKLHKIFQAKISETKTFVFLAFKILAFKFLDLLHCSFLLLHIIKILLIYSNLLRY